jgi:hypothetical protein
MTLETHIYTRWFKYDRDDLRVNKSQFVPVIFEPLCICNVAELMGVTLLLEKIHIPTLLFVCNRVAQIWLRYARGI